MKDESGSKKVLSYILDHLQLSVAGASLVLCVILFYLATKFRGSTHDMLIALSSSAISIALTVGLVDHLNRQRDLRYIAPSQNDFVGRATTSLLRVADAIFSTITEPSERTDLLKKVFTPEMLGGDVVANLDMMYLEELKVVERTKPERFEELTGEDLMRVIETATNAASQIDEYRKEYDYALPPELKRKILIIKDRLTTSSGLIGLRLMMGANPKSIPNVGKSGTNTVQSLTRTIKDGLKVLQSTRTS